MSTTRLRPREAGSRRSRPIRGGARRAAHRLEIEDSRCHRDPGARQLTYSTSPTAAAADVIVIGSGIAGLSAALSAAERARVLVLSKGAADDGCTRWAQGGIAAAIGDGDSADLHYEDTVAAGRGLCDPRAVRILVDEAPRRIDDLIGWGVTFDREGDRFSLHQEAAHSQPRVLHAGGDATGLEIEMALLRRLHLGNVDVLEGQAATRLRLDDTGRCIGVEVVDLASGERRALCSGAVILATGGAAGLWGHSTNPAAAGGQGIALAYEAGAEVADVEFIQFHPTTMAMPGSGAFLISESLRGAGAEVVDAAGNRFLLDADPRGELAPRDIVARTIWHEMARTHSRGVFLDCRPIGPNLVHRFPSVVGACRERGLDPTRTPIPIAPAAHYTIGGVVTNTDGATSVPGLYACGEVARSGVHGANRLASNSLLEGVVFGRRAAHAALRDQAELPPPASPRRSLEPAPVGRDQSGAATAVELGWLLWEACGISRQGASLGAAVAAIDDMKLRLGDPMSPPARDLQLSLTTAGLVTAAALAREESRGAHHRGDHPETIDRWHGSYVMQIQRGAHLDDDPATHR